MWSYCVPAPACCSRYPSLLILLDARALMCQFTKKQTEREVVHRNHLKTPCDFQDNNQRKTCFKEIVFILSIQQTIKMSTAWSRVNSFDVLQPNMTEKSKHNRAEFLRIPWSKTSEGNFSCLKIFLLLISYEVPQITPDIINSWSSESLSHARSSHRHI